MTDSFAVTSFFVAFLSVRDIDHETAVDLMENFEGRIVTTAWVLVELGNFLAKSSIRNLFAAFVRDLPTDPRFEIIAADRGQFESGCALDDARPDKAWSYSNSSRFATSSPPTITLSFEVTGMCDVHSLSH